MWVVDTVFKTAYSLPTWIFKHLLKIDGDVNKGDVSSGYGSMNRKNDLQNKLFGIID